MKIPTMLLFLFAAATASAQLPDHAQIFLLIGQSNMAGRGAVGTPDPVDPRIMCLNKELQWIPAQDPLHFDRPSAGVGPGLAFAQALVQADPSLAIGLVPCAVGGSSLDQWAPGGKLYASALARARVALEHGTLAGILWHQGEADSKPELVATYGARFSAMIAQLRQDLNAGNVPVVIGELGRFRLENASVEFNANLPTVAALVPRCAYVTSEDLVDRGDHLHFDTPSARILGRRYATAYLKMKESP